MTGQWLLTPNGIASSYLAIELTIVDILGIKIDESLSEPFKLAMSAVESEVFILLQVL